MAQELFDGFSFSVETDEKNIDHKLKTEGMAQEIMKIIMADVEFLGIRELVFSIRLREYNLRNGDDATWEAELIRPKDNNMELDESRSYVIATQQFYKALHKLSADFNYAGYFEVEVALRSKKHTEQQLRPFGEIISRLINDAYRSQIYAYFPDWETDYVDGIHFLQ